MASQGVKTYDSVQTKVVQYTTEPYEGGAIDASSKRLRRDPYSRKMVEERQEVGGSQIDRSR
jgi:hypothetical protein